MTETTETWLFKTIKEIKKHADRDDCYNCKQLLKFGPAKRFVEALEAKPTQ